MVWDQDKPLLMSTQDFTRCWSPWQSPRSTDTSRKTASSSCTDAQSCQISLKYASPHGASVCRLSWRSHLTRGLVDSPSRLFVHPWPCATDCTSPFLLFRLGKKKEKKRKERQRSTKDAQNCSYFCFLGKKKIKVFLFCCVQGFHENRQRSNLLFSLRESRGALIFSLPIQEWIIIVRLPWVTTQRSSVPRFTFKWNQMAVHSGMIYSNDDGNKSKVLFHIGLGCYLGLLSFGDFAGTVGELCLCYVKTITFAFQRVDSSTRCLTDLM